MPKEPPELPQLHLDELLEELQARLARVRGTRDRLRALLEAILSVGRELDLDAVLQRIVDAAATLVDARYGALGVIGEDQRLTRFITTGLTPQQHAAIGALPTGHGILGELIRHPVPLRLENLAAHPASTGFPANHPPMRGFVGVPIRIGDQVFGNLYLTEKRGGAPFDAEDESLLQTLAMAASVALDNARLYQATRLREHWLATSGRITGLLLSGAPEQEVLGDIVHSCLDIFEADLGAIALPLPAGGGLVVQYAEGLDAEEHRGLHLPAEGFFMGSAYATGRTLTSGNIAKDPRVTAGPRRWEDLGPAVAAPLGQGAGHPRGVLMLARRTDRHPFTPEESAPLQAFADQAAVALELAARRHDAEQLTLAEDHDRIARDLHDLAIQRLFATGMTLQSAGRFITRPEAAERVRRAVEDLDETVKIIRTAIFGLRARTTPIETAGLRARLAGIAGRFTTTLGYTPSLRLEGLLDTDVPPDIADDVLAALEEALSNVARHAHATAVDITARATTNPSPQVVLTVTDNGTGLSETGRRSGLANLHQRATHHHGTLTVEQAPGGGTRLTWCAPLPDL